MTYKLKFVLGIALAFAVTLSLVVFFTARKTEANPLGFSCPSYSNTATTSPVYMTPGTATSTVVFDTYCINGTNQPNTGNTFASNGATLFLQFNASSTFSTLNTTVEYSQDNIDWYQDNYLTNATTSMPFEIASSTKYEWVYASSTLNGVTPNDGRINKMLRLYTPTRYLRVVNSLASTSGAGIKNGAVWTAIVPFKENK